MRILEVTAAGSGVAAAGGGERYVQGLVRELARTAEVRLACAGPSDPPADLAIPARSYLVPPFLYPTNPVPTFASVGAMARFLRREGPRIDVVHVHNLRTLVSSEWLTLARFVGGSHRPPIVLTDHGARFVPWPRLWAGRVDAYAPVSRWSEQQLMGWARHPSRLLPAAVAPEFVQSPPSTDPERSFDLLFLGRLVPWKRPEAVLRVAAEAGRLLGRRVSVVLAGRSYDPSFTAELKRRASATPGVDARLVEDPGNAQALALFRAARVHVLLSDYTDEAGRRYVAPELSSATTLEAAAVGTPTVATGVGGVAELITDGENGFLVPTGDFVAASERVARLLSDDALRRRLGAAGAAFVRAERTWPIVARHFLDFAAALLRGEAA
jgi:glycosyltransferase involved in cell wall biosynthesis